MIIVNNKGELWYKKKRYKCAYGKNGFKKNKKEGDGCTPIGIFSIGPLFIRLDRIKKIQTKIKYKPILPNMAWEDNPKSKNYNKLIFLKKRNSQEKLFRKDKLYDLILIIKYNTKKIIKNKGSAIFLHIAKKKYIGTQGCIAISKKSFLEILKKLNPKEKINIMDTF